MSLFAPKSGSGLSINTTAANNSGTSPFGSTSSSQPQTSGGLFPNLGATQSQPQQAGGLFGSTSQTAQTGSGLFGNLGQNANSSQPQSGGLFSNVGNSQPQQATLGNNPQTSQAGPSLFSNVNQNTSSSQPQITGLFGNLGQSQAQQASSLFAPNQTSANQAQPASSMPSQSSGFPGFKLGNTNAANPVADPAQPAHQSSGVKINLEHLRTTTRYEQLADDLQKEISELDSYILNQITRAHEVSDVVPLVAQSGNNLPNDVTFVSDKLEELQLGLENDATGLHNLRDKVVAKDASEAKLCFRGVERLKIPPQYRQQQLYQSVSGAGSGLAGWWNHPQTLQKSLRGAAGAGGRRNLQLPDEEDEEAKGPSNLVEYFEKRTVEMTETLKGYNDIMQEIESHLDGVEMTISAKQRELLDNRFSGGVMGSGADEQIRNLRYALGVFERSIYDVADQVGTARDGVQELVLGRAGVDSRLGQSRLAW